MGLNVSKEELIVFLDTNYKVEDNVFVTTYDDTQEWGRDIIHLLSKVYFSSTDSCTSVFKYWALDLGLSDEEIEQAMGVRKLRASWSPEMAQDVSSLYNIDAEAELTAILSREISREIDAQILTDLDTKINSGNILSIVKCLGYEATATIYDPDTFIPVKSFISMKQKDINDERQNNPIWQDWIRTRGLHP